MLSVAILICVLICELHCIPWPETLETDFLNIPKIPKWPFVKPEYPPNSMQSPVDVDTTYAVPLILDPIIFYKFMDMPDQSVIVKNTGYYLELTLEDDVAEEDKPYVSGGPLLQCKYIFEQAHVHWGKVYRKGSEHAVNGNKHSLEFHFVFYKSEYENYDNAINHADGIAVVGYFGDEFLFDNPDFDELMNLIPEIIPAKSETRGSFNKEFTFFEKLFKQRIYYAFPGSLTTKPYKQCVTWVLYRDSFPISAAQIEAFHQLKSSDGKHIIDQNDRPLQPFNRRPIITPRINGTPKKSTY